jgi:hypothetical protein
MYTDTPKSKVINISENVTDNSLEIKKNNQNEITDILKMEVEQNYFQLNKYYKPKIGNGCSYICNISLQYISNTWSVNNYIQFY